MALLVRFLFRFGCSCGLLFGSILLSACTSEHSSGTPSDATSTRSADSSARDTVVRSVRRPQRENRADDERTLSQKLDDARLEARIKQALVEDGRLRVFDFFPQVSGPRVTLRGDVNTVDQYTAAEQVARHVTGVDSVTNALTIEGRPVTEERLTAIDSSSSDEEVYHTVRRGESLWLIARQYSTSVRRLRSLNGLQSGALRPGQRIRVR